MLEDLRNASKQLQVALEHYLHICSSIRDLCLQGSAMWTVPSQYVSLINRELGLAESYEAKVEQAKLAIKVARSHTFNISPINSLPPEILTHMFHMARDEEPRSIDRLVAVCSLWRSISLNSPSLWSRIEFNPRWFKWFYPELDRARLHLSRSGEVPLDFYLWARSEAYNKDQRSYTPLKDLCELVAPRMRSLHLDLEEFSGGRDDRTSQALNTLVSHCVPGMLNKLVIKDIDRPGIITTTDGGDVHDPTLKIHLKRADLDRIFSSISVLHLSGAFLRWDSHAYHGLVDLRLYLAVEDIGGRGIYTIPEAQLVTILKASPGLRIIHLELRITHQSGEGVPVPRVRVTELEVVQIWIQGGAPFDRFGGLLRLLEPGVRPLHLALRGGGEISQKEHSTSDATAFFSRARMTKLAMGYTPHLFKLLSSSPHLKILVLFNQKHWWQPKISTRSDSSNVESQATYPELDECFLLNCSLSLDELLLLTRRCQPRILTLYGGTYYRGRSNQEIEMKIVERQLSNFCPDVRITSTRPSFEEHPTLFTGH